MGHLQVVILTFGVAIPPPTPLQTENNPAHFIATAKVKLQPEDGPHTGPKHVVVSPMY